MVRGLLSYFNALRTATFSRAEVKALRKAKLRGTLEYAFDNSSFYRKKWEAAGITRTMLDDLPLERLPVVDKRELMEHFEEVLTDSSITRSAVEDFFKKDPQGLSWFRGHYVAIHTSGSSGFVGIFLFTKAFWEHLIGTTIARLFPLSLTDIVHKSIRIVFVGETSGHHAGYSIVNDIPLFQTLNVDVSWPKERLVSEIRAFNPNLVIGYASGVALLAEAQKEGLLQMRPRAIITSGEPLSTEREQRIIEAFGVRPINFYGATECLSIGASLHTSGVLDVFDDIVYLEAINDEGKCVPPGSQGRAVITLLHNDIFPLIRYALDDELTILKDSGDSPFTQVGALGGRKVDRLTFSIGKGKKLEVHPMDLVGMFFPGLLQYQVVQTGTKTAKLRMVVEGSKERALKYVKQLAAALMKEKGIGEDDIDISFEFVDRIEPDPKTGKTPMIVPYQRKSQNAKRRSAAPSVDNAEKSLR